MMILLAGLFYELFSTESYNSPTYELFSSPENYSGPTYGPTYGPTGQWKFVLDRHISYT